MPKWTDYTIKTNPSDKDEVMILDTAGKANKRLGLSALSDWAIGKIASKVFENLQTQNKTILGAINELNSKASVFGGNIKKVGFRSGKKALNNIYLDFYDSNNSRTSLAFTSDGENTIKLIVNDVEKWRVVVK